MGQLKGKYSNYGWILAILITSFLIHIILLLIFYNGEVTRDLLKVFTPRVLDLIRAFLFAGVGSTVICTLFAAEDKDRTEKLANTASQETLELEFPSIYDIWFYITRIITGSFLGVIAVMLYNSGLLILKSDNSDTLIKNLGMVVAFLIGFYQFRFVRYLNGLATKILDTPARNNNPAKQNNEPKTNSAPDQNIPPNNINTGQQGVKDSLKPAGVGAPEAGHAETTAPPVITTAPTNTAENSNAENNPINTASMPQPANANNTPIPAIVATPEANSPIVIAPAVNSVPGSAGNSDVSENPVNNTGINTQAKNISEQVTFNKNIPVDRGRNPNMEYGDDPNEK